ncbi:MAG: type II toxin-antitoxin system PemK/MazF family toxin [Abitibacteriaceae bacterium]|nr:type II toxin-antitoxin system PemK/MazF family toxin [Abditibacteriaceae bacterium]
MSIDPKRGEIWRIDLEPARGAEMKKTRPAVVISRDSIRHLPLRLVVPLTEMQPHFTAQSWKVLITPDANNGLTKLSAADASQVRGVDLSRFTSRIGKLPPATLDDIAAAIALIVDYKPNSILPSAQAR